MLSSRVEKTFICLSVLMICGTRSEPSFHERGVELEEDANPHQMDRRGSWASLQGSWGKRKNFEDLFGAKQALNFPGPLGVSTAYLLQVPSTVEVLGSSEEMLSDEVLKRPWPKMIGSWGKRSPNSSPKTISPRSTNWSSLRGSWGKRGDTNWNQLRGTWGKRPLHITDASEYEGLNPSTAK